MAKILGIELGHDREIRILNRVIRWETDGIVYEPDQRHAEMLVGEFGLEGVGSVLTPGTRAKHEVASAQAGMLGKTNQRTWTQLMPFDSADLQRWVKKRAAGWRGRAQVTGSCGSEAIRIWWEPQGTSSASAGKAA